MLVCVLTLCTGWGQIEELNLPGHWIQTFFNAHMDLELQRNKQVIVNCERCFCYQLQKLL